MRYLFLGSILFLSLEVFGQMAMTGTENCKLFEKGNFSYCVDPSTYKVNWTSAIVYGNHIENQTYIPPDKEFFKEIPQQISMVWLNIEKQVKMWAIEFDSVYVITGKTTIAASDSLTPPLTAYYKALLKGCGGDALAFIVQEQNGGKSIEEYIVTIDALEEITGINFFFTLDESLQEIIEAEYNLKFWPITDFNVY